MGCPLLRSDSLILPYPSLNPIKGCEGAPLRRRKCRCRQFSYLFATRWRRIEWHWRPKYWKPTHILFRVYRHSRCNFDNYLSISIATRLRMLDIFGSLRSVLINGDLKPIRICWSYVRNCWNFGFRSAMIGRTITVQSKLARQLTKSFIFRRFWNILWQFSLVFWLLVLAISQIMYLMLIMIIIYLRPYS